MLDNFTKVDATTHAPATPRYEQWFPVDTTSADYLMEGDITLGGWATIHPEYDQTKTAYKASCASEPLVVGYQAADAAGYKLGVKCTKMATIDDIYVLGDSWAWEDGYLYVNTAANNVNPSNVARIQAFSTSSLKFDEPQLWIYESTKVPSEFMMTFKALIYAGHTTGYNYAASTSSVLTGSDTPATMCFYFGINDAFSLAPGDYTLPNPLLKIMIQSSHFTYLTTGNQTTYKNAKHYRVGYSELHTLNKTGQTVNDPTILYDTGTSYVFGTYNTTPYYLYVSEAHQTNWGSLGGGSITLANAPAIPQIANGTNGNLKFLDNRYDEGTQTNIYGGSVLCGFNMWITIKYQDGILSLFDEKNKVYISSFQLPYRQILPGYFAFGVESYNYMNEITTQRDYVSCIAIDDLEVHGIVTDVKLTDIMQSTDTKDWTKN